VAVQGDATELNELGTPGVDRLRAMPVVTWLPGRDRWFAIMPALITGRRLPVQGLARDAGWYEGILG
jgi:hypothetical protein